MEDHARDYIGVIFDAKGDTFRNEIYDQYKANRDAPPEDLTPQFPLVRDATRALNLSCIERPGFEADDNLTNNDALEISVSTLGDANSATLMVWASGNPSNLLVEDKVVLTGAGHLFTTAA